MQHRAREGCFRTRGGGLFSSVSDSGTQWQEITSDGSRFEFRETLRTPHTLTLYDRTRDMSVAITEQEYMWASGRGEGGEWHVLGQGEWVGADEGGETEHSDFVCKFKTIGGFEEMVRWNAETAVEQIKHRIAVRCGITVGSQVWCHRGRIVREGRLSENGIADGDTIIVVKSTRPPASSPIATRDSAPTVSPSSSSHHTNIPVNNTSMPNPWAGERSGTVPAPRAPQQPYPATVQQRVGRREGPPEQEGDVGQCRICLAGGEDGPLFSPCLCRGTVRLVHRACLNEWRSASSNPLSFFRCDQCGYEYRIVRTRAAAVLQSEALAKGVSMICLLLLLLVTGGICVVLNLGVHTRFYEAVSWFPFWRQSSYAAWAPLLDLLVAGGVVTGCSGAGLVLRGRYIMDPDGFWGSLVPVIVFNWICVGLRIMRLFCFLGLCVAWYHGLYPTVKQLARRWLMEFGERVLEVHQPHPEEEEEE